MQTTKRALIDHSTVYDCRHNDD